LTSLTVARRVVDRLEDLGLLKRYTDAQPSTAL
jgi:hypothetical protein